MAEIETGRETNNLKNPVLRMELNAPPLWIRET